MNELDKLKHLAETNWSQFLEIVGDDFIITAKARLLRYEGKSWQQISMKLAVTPMKARTLAKAVKKKQTEEK